MKFEFVNVCVISLILCVFLDKFVWINGFFLSFCLFVCLFLSKVEDNHGGGKVENRLGPAVEGWWRLGKREAVYLAKENNNNKKNN